MKQKEQFAIMQTQPMNMAVIGVGFWGKNLVRTFRAMRDVNVSVLCDSRSDSVRAIEAQGARFSTNYKDVLADRAIDAVAIATEIPTHYQLVKDSLESGKHVFVEKPLSMVPEEVIELTALAASNNLVLFVDYLLLYLPALKETKGIIRDDHIGRVRWIHQRRLHPPRQGDYSDVVADFLPHDFSVLHYILDEFPAEVVSASQSELGAKGCSVSTILLRFPSGILANLNLSRVHTAKQRTSVIHCTRGMLSWDQSGNEIVIDSETPVPRVVAASTKVAEPLLLACRDFAKRSRNRVFPDHDLALNLAKTFQAIKTSEREQRWVRT